MRTTVTLDSDVAAKLKQLVHRRGSTFKETINEVLRRGLSAVDAKDEPAFVVVPHAGKFRPGLDLGKLNQLLDDLETADFVDESTR